MPALLLFNTFRSKNAQQKFLYVLHSYVKRNWYRAHLFLNTELSYFFQLTSHKFFIGNV